MVALNSAESPRASSDPGEWPILVGIRHESPEVKICKDTIVFATEDSGRRSSRGPSTTETLLQDGARQLPGEQALFPNRIDRWTPPAAEHSTQRGRPLSRQTSPG